MMGHNDERLQISILDAVETLSDIAELDFDREVQTATPQEIQSQNQMVAKKTAKWDHYEDPESSAKVITETFKVVLNYLRNFYQHDNYNFEKPKIVEGVKTIMVLVGEAAQKLDKYTTIFLQTKNHACHQLKEFKELQDFYLTRVAHKVDDKILGKWILELTKGAVEQRHPMSKLEGAGGFSTKYEFVDFEAIKNDVDYELLLMRKEDGSRFYNPRLIRNIKLVCDFGERINPVIDKDDPLKNLPTLHDYAIHIVAKNIVESQGNLLNIYFHEVKNYSKHLVVADLNKALIALLMSANPKNLLRNSPIKCSSEYFADFQYFLRSALGSSEYQKYLSYGSHEPSKIAHIVLDTVHHLCQGLISNVHGYYDLISAFEGILYKAIKEQNEENKNLIKGKINNEEDHELKSHDTISSRLASDFSAMVKMIRHHPNGALNRNIELLEHKLCHSFDPIIQSNLPSQLFSIDINNKKTTNIRIPTPTHQEFIYKAFVVPEFLGFLRGNQGEKSNRKHLMINLQDKTSWKEHARCLALEGVQTIKDFSQVLSVVTLTKETDFYYQQSSYHLDRHANVFIQHFKENLEDDGCGFYFPKKIKDLLFPNFIDNLLKAIHQIFFSGMNVLTVESRLQFIEIFYLFLTLKLIEIEAPDSFSMTCKDGLDVGCVASAQFYTFLKILKNEKMVEEDYIQIDLMLHAPTLLIRERIIHKDRFNRMINTLKKLEQTKQEMGVNKFNATISDLFGSLYGKGIWEGLDVRMAG